MCRNRIDSAYLISANILTHFLTLHFLIKFANQTKFIAVSYTMSCYCLFLPLPIIVILDQKANENRVDFHSSWSYLIRLKKMMFISISALMEMGYWLLGCSRQEKLSSKKCQLIRSWLIFSWFWDTRFC